jgi:hypothetical protein
MDHALPIAICVDVDVDIISVANAAEHSWKVRAGRMQQERAATARALESIERPQWPAYFVSLIRCATRSLDDDNLQSSLKSVRDQVAQWLGLDDVDARVEWQYATRIAKVINDRVRPRSKYKTWARVRISPVKEDLAELDSAVRLRAPRSQPQELDDARNARFVQKPGAIPDYAGGTPIAIVELAPREDTTTKSRIRVRLMKNTQKRGIGYGVQYVHACVFWTDARGQAWRSQGMGLRQEELRDFANVLLSMADRLGVPAREGVGVIFSGDRVGRGTDTPSKESKNKKDTERPFSSSNKKPRPNSHAKDPANKPVNPPLDKEPPPPPPPPGWDPHAPPWWATPPTPKVKNHPHDVNATAEDADDEIG